MVYLEMEMLDVLSLWSICNLDGKFYSFRVKLNTFGLNTL